MATYGHRCCFLAVILPLFSFSSIDFPIWHIFCNANGRYIYYNGREDYKGRQKNETNTTPFRKEDLHTCCHLYAFWRFGVPIIHRPFALRLPLWHK